MQWISKMISESSDAFSALLRENFLRGFRESEAVFLVVCEPFYEQAVSDLDP
jgi:hypothetical protein